MTSKMAAHREGAFNRRPKFVGAHINMELANIQNYNHTIGGQAVELRALLSHGEPWFRGTDVAGVLGYKDVKKAIRTHVDEEDKQTLENLRRGEMAPLLNNYEKAQVFINESGLYSLILKSKKEGAQIFKRWVTSEVLPQIRRTGAYVANNTCQSSQQRDLGPSAQQVRRLALENDDLELRNMVAIRQALIDAGEELDAAQKWSFRDRLNNLMKGDEKVEIADTGGLSKLMDAGEFLTQKGFKASVVAKTRSAFGKLAAAIKRQELGLDKKAELPWKLKNVEGHETKVNVYKIPEECCVLEKALEELQKTPQFVVETGLRKRAMATESGWQRKLNWN